MIKQKDGMNKIGLTAVCAIFCLFFTGCSVYRRAAQTLCMEPKLFPTQKDSYRTKCRDHEWADSAWHAELAANPQAAGCKEFEQGFKEGFADYLYAGGTGEPPPVPPRRFWNLDYRNPDGQMAVENWFAGFRHGAGAAREGGYREQVTIKSSLLSCKSVGYTAPNTEMMKETKPLEVIPTPQPTEPTMIDPPLPRNDGLSPKAEPPSREDGAATPVINLQSPKSTTYISQIQISNKTKKQL